MEVNTVTASCIFCIALVIASDSMPANFIDASNPCIPAIAVFPTDSAVFKRIPPCIMASICISTPCNCFLYSTNCCALCLNSLVFCLPCACNAYIRSSNLPMDPLKSLVLIICVSTAISASSNVVLYLAICVVRSRYSLVFCFPCTAKRYILSSNRPTAAEVSSIEMEDWSTMASTSRCTVFSLVNSANKSLNSCVFLLPVAAKVYRRSSIAEMDPLTSSMLAPNTLISDSTAENIPCNLDSSAPRALYSCVFRLPAMAIFSI